MEKHEPACSAGSHASACRTANGFGLAPGGPVRCESPAFGAPDRLTRMSLFTVAMTH